MKLKEYVARLNKIIAKDPANGELELVYAIDEEGNAFHTVYNDPTIGFYSDRDSEFVPLEMTKNDPDYSEYENKKPNALCIN